MLADMWDMRSISFSWSCTINQIATAFQQCKFALYPTISPFADEYKYVIGLCGKKMDIKFAAYDKYISFTEI